MPLLFCGARAICARRSRTARGTWAPAEFAAGTRNKTNLVSIYPPGYSYTGLSRTCRAAIQVESFYYVTVSHVFVSDVSRDYVRGASTNKASAEALRGRLPEAEWAAAAAYLDRVGAAGSLE